MLNFTYDESGHPLTMRRYFNEAQSNYCTYHYILNAQGDVVKLMYGTNKTVAEYSYDAWGNLLRISGAELGNLSVAELNPLRYRGYYCDSETGFYYLQSRYYDPIVRRFLNADSYGSTGQGILGYNSFAYCCNNPAARKDDTGHRYYCNDIMEGRVSARDGYDVYGYEFSDGCNMPEYDARSKSFYYKPNQYGRVFIAPYSDNPSIPSDFGGNDVLILDNRNHYVTPENMPDQKHYDPSFKILDSYKITNYLQQKAIIEVLCDYNARNPSEPTWNHSVDTAIQEWQIHNFGFYWSRTFSSVSGTMGKIMKSCREADLDNDDIGRGMFAFFTR